MKKANGLSDLMTLVLTKSTAEFNVITDDMISHLVIKFESFDCAAFVEALRKESPNGLTIVWNYSGAIEFRQIPDRLYLPKIRSYFRPGGWNENRWIKWPSFLIKMSWIIAVVAIQTKIETFYIGGGDVLLWYAQIFKRLGRIQKTVSTMEDWSIPSPHQTFYERINRIKIALNDWILPRIDTKVLVFNREIFEARKRHLGEFATHNFLLMENQWAWFLKQLRQGSAPKQRRTIVQIGTVRDHFGMQMLFDVMPTLHQELGVTLRFIGPENDIYRRYRQQSEKLGLKGVDWRGFVSNSELPKALEDCFCGVNLQENPVNDSQLTIAGRVVQYLQYLVTPVMTVHSGALVPILSEKNLAIVISPDRDELIKAVRKAFVEQDQYAERMSKFLATNPYRRSTNLVTNFV